MHVGRCTDKHGGQAKARTFRELSSIVSSPFGYTWQTAPTGVDWGRIKRGVAILLIVVLSILAVMKANHLAAPALDVAEVGQCYIVPEDGATWHGVRQCRALAHARHVQRTSLTQAQRMGAGVRWPQPCRICASMLRAIPEYREKREEIELRLHERAVVKPGSPLPDGSLGRSPSTG